MGTIHTFERTLLFSSVLFMTKKTTFFLIPIEFRLFPVQTLLVHTKSSVGTGLGKKECKTIRKYVVSGRFTKTYDT